MTGRLGLPIPFRYIFRLSLSKDDRRPRQHLDIAMLLWVGCLTTISGATQAEVKSKSPNGFHVAHHIETSLAPEQVFQAITDEIAYWWSASHTYSNDSSRLYIDLSSERCFCERLSSGGKVTHLAVVYHDPGKVLRLIGGLGPLQALGANGALTWTITPKKEGAELSMSYRVSGYYEKGMDSLAGPVDGMWTEQIRALGNYLNARNAENK